MIKGRFDKIIDENTNSQIFYYKNLDIKSKLDFIKQLFKELNIDENSLRIFCKIPKMEIS
ncbi:UNVERIFIED_CONTAM: hypothetical protein O8I53_08385 [Campylobacter lari]